MSSERARLLEATREAGQRHAAGRAAARAAAPAPGDLYVLTASSEHPVEWAVLEGQPEGGGRVLAVPADGNVLAGSADVAVPASAPCGPLTLRCRFAGWLDAGLFAGQPRIGRLDPGEVERAHRRWSEIGEGIAAGSLLEREVDEDPEYQDWLDEVVAPAWRALFDEGGDRGQRTGAAIEPARRPSAIRSPPMLLAASILLMVTAGLAGSLLWRQQQRIDGLLAEGERSRETHRREVEELEAERDRTAAALRELAETAGQIDAGAERQLRERIDELDRRLEEALRQGAVVNPVIAALDLSGVVRGEVETLKLPPDASHAVLLLPLGDSPPAPEYRVELLEEGSGERIWQTRGLRAQSPAEVRVGLPVSMLAPGEYRVRLQRLEAGQFRGVNEYRLRVDSE